MEIKGEYTHCIVCGDKIPWYMHLCERCRYALLAYRRQYDYMTDEEISTGLEIYDNDPEKFTKLSNYHYTF